MQFAQPFERWDRDRRGADIHSMRTLQAIGYLTSGEHTLTRTDFLVLREEWRAHRWASASDAALVVTSAGEGALLFDWQVRRPSLLEAGAQEVWVLDPERQCILRQGRGEAPLEVRYAERGQTTT
jgi:hypothetical protein